MLFMGLQSLSRTLHPAAPDFPSVPPKIRSSRLMSQLFWCSACQLLHFVMEIERTPLPTEEEIEFIAGFRFHPESVGFLWGTENPAFAKGIFVLPDIRDLVVLSFGER
jgi:hypothetical protein